MVKKYMTSTPRGWMLFNRLLINFKGGYMPKFLSAMKYGEKVFTKNGQVTLTDSPDLQDFIAFCHQDDIKDVIGRTGVVKAFATTKSSQSYENKNRPVQVEFFSKYGCNVTYWCHPSWLEIIDTPVVDEGSDETAE